MVFDVWFAAEPIELVCARRLLAQVGKQSLNLKPGSATYAWIRKGTLRTIVRLASCFWAKARSTRSFASCRTVGVVRTFL
ncbi:protein of unknown function [Methylocaldum szegediense]|uniref:Uncharacterized protein n=1 Tax=Methylocaldum szegediense TaxID=73780 RepID=A0ABN8X3X1_9GAMM|nr:protein of unknown function [Methylocaldum szegediense]